MKKQITALFCSAVICGTVCVAVMPRANATEELYAEKITIAAYELASDLDIFSADKVSVTDEWVFNMVYDRLLEADDSGYLQPSLIESWEFVGYDSYSMSKLKSLPPAGDWDNSWEYHNLLPDSPFEAEGYKSDLPTRGWDEYLDGDGLLIIQLNFREGLNFNDDCPINAETVREMIYNVKGLNSDTLIYKQWQPVYKVECIDDLTMHLYLSFSDLNYGFMDFMYGLASPYGSIVHKDGDEIIGSGAYNIISNTSEGVTLERNEDWWGGSVPTQYVTFKTNENNADRYGMLNSGEADIGILNGEDSVNQYDEYAFNYEYVETNPIVAFYNPNNDILQDVRMRKACDYSIDNNYLGNCDNLSDKSNDFWAYVDSYDYNYAKQLISDAGYDIYVNDVPLRILALENDIFSDIATVMVESLRRSGINTYLYLVSEDQFEFKALSGDYDIILTEIDLYNVDSIYNSFIRQAVSCSDIDLHRYLELAKSAAAEGSYFRSYYDVQKYCYNEQAYMTYFGWRNKVVASNFDVKGFELPQGLHPLGDMSRMDFRRVYKTV